MLISLPWIRLPLLVLPIPPPVQPPLSASSWCLSYPLLSLIFACIAIGLRLLDEQFVWSDFSYHTSH